MKKVKDWIEEIGENICEKCGELKKEHSFSSIGSGYLICPVKEVKLFYANTDEFKIRVIKCGDYSFSSSNIILKAAETFIIKDIPGELAKSLFELLKNGIEKLDEEELRERKI